MSTLKRVGPHVVIAGETQEDASKGYQEYLDSRGHNKGLKSRVATDPKAFEGTKGKVYLEILCRGYLGETVDPEVQDKENPDVSVMEAAVAIHPGLTPETLKKQGGNANVDDLIQVAKVAVEAMAGVMLGGPQGTNEVSPEALEESMANLLMILLGQHCHQHEEVRALVYEKAQELVEILARDPFVLANYKRPVSATVH